MFLIPYLVYNIHVSDRKIKVLAGVHCIVNMVLDKILDGDTEEGIDSVVFPGDRVRQLLVVDLDVSHGHLERVPLGLDQFPGRLQVLGLVVAFVSPFLEEVLELLLAELSHLVPHMVGFNLNWSNIHCCDSGILS